MTLLVVSSLCMALGLQFITQFMRAAEKDFFDWLFLLFAGCGILFFFWELIYTVLIPICKMGKIFP